MTNYTVTETIGTTTYTHHITGCTTCDETGRTYVQGYDHDSGCSDCSGYGVVSKTRANTKKIISLNRLHP